VENLLLAWREFLKGKRSKKDVQEFQVHLMDNILLLHKDLMNKRYIHGGYYAFNISDPKPRNIHKASVRDRLLHHAIYRILYPFFDKKFIADSYSCRKWKGTHRALKRFQSLVYKVSKNNTNNMWVLKCDVKKFFASIDQEILFKILRKHLRDEDIIWLIQQVVVSFNTSPSKGLPLGNLTSQLLVNVYMNEFDQYMKNELRVKYYIRYADDFVILHQDKECLFKVLGKIENFLKEKLKLLLHPDKVSIKTISSGVDFLGWVHFFDHRVLRTTTKKRMYKKLEGNPKEETIISYRGLLSHGNTNKLQNKIILNNQDKSYL
jgi:retron-type reverse transcriptase